MIPLARQSTSLPARSRQSLRTPLTLFIVSGFFLGTLGPGTSTPLKAQAIDARPETSVLAATGPALSVDASANQHAISPYIYGLNFAKESFAREINLPLRRWGGNATSRYDWQTGNSSTANDWYFENIALYNPYTNTNENHVQWIDQNVRTLTQSLITIPIVGYVAKDGTSCSFSITKYGAQQSSDPYRPDCGNGTKPDGTLMTGNYPADTSVVVDPTFMKNWVLSLVTKYGTASSGGVGFYALDNEPDLWGDTHRDVHPSPQTYDELLSKTEAYGAAIKAADPSAQIFGYSSFGWTGYWYSEYDTVTAANNGYTFFPDLQSHGNQNQVVYYLDQLHQYQVTNGTRLLDYLDLHFYPENGVALTTAGDVNQQALRLRSTRSLWDPTYRDESWIGGNYQPVDWQYVRLIPRMHNWVNTYYPLTKLAISEYNWGGLENINGALAQADILGIFGREGLDAATLWNYPNSGDGLGYDHFETLPGSYAFRIYRNYDGAGSTFGDTSVQSSSSNQDQLSIYAARRSTDHALTLMVINKTAQTLTSTVSLAHFQPGTLAQVFHYSSSNLSAIVQAPNLAVTPGGFTADFPANSVTLIAIPQGSPTVSGNVGVNGAKLSYTDGVAKSATAQADGAYSFQLSNGWSGTVTPQAACYNFNPTSRSYNNVTTDQGSQNYSATLSPGCIPASGTYDDTNAGWIYSSGTWSSYSASGPYNGTEHYSNALGATASFTFSGSGFNLFYSSDSNRSNIQVWVDGVMITTISEYGPHLYQQSYSSPVLPAGNHTVQFKNVGGSGPYMTIDAIQISAPDTTPPSAISDLAASTSPGINGAVHLTWTAPGNDGTVGTATSYLVRFSSSAITTEPLWSAATPVSSGIPTPAVSGTPQSMDVTGLTSGNTYFFSVRAVDAASNMGALSNSPSAVASTISTPTPAVYDDSDPGWTFANGTWLTYSASGPFGGSEHYSNTLNATASFTFNGSGFHLLYSSDSNRANVQVSVDGSVVTTFSQNGSHLYQQSYTSPVFPTGSHTVQFKNVGGSGAYMTIDALKVFILFDDTDPGWTFANGTWLTYSATGPIGGSEHYSNNLNGTATFTFSGGGFVLYYSGDSNRCNVQVSVSTPSRSCLKDYSSEIEALHDLPILLDLVFQSLKIGELRLKTSNKNLNFRGHDILLEKYIQISFGSASGFAEPEISPSMHIPGDSLSIPYSEGWCADESDFPIFQYLCHYHFHVITQLAEFCFCPSR